MNAPRYFWRLSALVEVVWLLGRLGWPALFVGLIVFAGFALLVLAVWKIVLFAAFAVGALWLLAQHRRRQAERPPF